MERTGTGCQSMEVCLSITAGEVKGRKVSLAREEVLANGKGMRRHMGGPGGEVGA